jgi:hypothetical protein
LHLGTLRAITDQSDCAEAQHINVVEARWRARYYNTIEESFNALCNFRITLQTAREMPKRNRHGSGVLIGRTGACALVAWTFVSQPLDTPLADPNKIMPYQSPDTQEFFMKQTHDHFHAADLSSKINNQDGLYVEAV